MTRRLFDSEYIFGIYEPGGERYMLAAGRPGWIFFSEAIGHDPQDRSGVDFSPFSDQGLGVICRVNNGYEPEGSLPHSSHYEEFARRAANFVATSRGCKIWVIGNEMNYAAERPGIVIDWTRHNTVRSGPPEVADPMRRGVGVRFNALPRRSTAIRTTRGAVISPGEAITPEMYARAYGLCRDAIRAQPGHEDDQVLVGAVAPWNTQTIYPGNPNGDWVDYFRDILQMLGPDNCDGFVLHAYTHGNDPALIDSDRRLDPPFQQRHAEFHVYQDFMRSVPESMRGLAAYISEAGPVDPWEDRNSGWIQRAYADVDAWNQEAGNQQIRAMILYRWPRIDRWFIEGKQGVIEDFQQALQHDYRWWEQTAAADAASTAVMAAPPTPKPEERPPYRVAWLDDSFPDRMLAGETITAAITVRNEGSLTWRWGGGNPFRLGYRYYRNRRRLSMPEEKDLRTDMPEDAPPGSTITLEARIALPDEPGNYTLELDMVQEGVTWFKEQGSPVLTRWLTVEAEAPTRDGDGTEDGDEAGLVPLFKDVVAALPRGDAVYARRSLDQVRYLVISHTAADPRMRLDAIAKAHIKRGYPGIAYDFVVDQGGQVYKVSQLEDVADPGERWSLQGVNIGLAGNFSQETPPLAQLDATGRLCAWLAQNLDLEPNAIVGLGELTRSDSPGRTFYHGVHWREILRRQVQLHLAVLQRGAADVRRAEDQEAIQALEARTQALADELAQARRAERLLRTRNEQIELELNELRRQFQARPDADEGRPPMRDVIERLPRDARRYTLRRPDQIEYIVINHTGAPPDTPLAKIAESHMPDWPGILYDFYIDATGAIMQTQPLGEVAATDQPYIARAINIAFAGDFNDAIPTGEQLYAGAQLIAWLMRRYPQLEVESIRGLSELVEHDSPGREWLEGAAWKTMLLAGVRRASGLVDPSEVEEALLAQVAELERRLQVLEHNNRALQDQRQRLQAEVEAMQAKQADPARERSHVVVSQPALRDMVDALPRHPTLRYPRRPRSRITHIAVHHTATLPTIGPMRIAELHVEADPARGKEAWPGIGYHFFIHADGSIDQTNELETVSSHVYRHDDYTLGVAFAGSFMNGSVPTPAQVRAGAHLIAWLMQELNIPLARVWGHREFPDNVTVCPGSEWTGGRRWRDDLFARIEQVQSGVGVKSIRHYLLFWQRPYPGPLARRDFINAVGYVARFRPTIGFSVEDARNAEYVTIVGGEAGVPAASERMLRAAGCKVERIAGRDEDETSRMLAELVRLNRRFRSFDVDF